MRISWITALASSVVALTIALPAVAANMTPELKALAAAADKEGEILVMWSASTMGGPKGAKVFEARMNKEYGTNLKIKWAPGPSMPRMGNRVAMSYTNSLPSPTDVYMGFSRNMATLQKHNIFASAPWEKYYPGWLDERVVEQNDTLVRVMSVTLGFTYNTKLAPFAPTKVSDFLKPGWKGKVATTPYAAGFEQLAAKEVWGAKKGIEFVESFTNQIAGFMRCSEHERLTSGEFLALVFDCSGDSMKRAIAKGAPLARIVPSDAPLVSYFYFGVPKNAVHPNGGKLLAAYAGSKDGQRTVYELTAGDNHALPGSEVGKVITGLEAKYGAKFVNADVNWQLANKAGNKAQKQAKKIMRKARKKKRK
jgi:ABC-type Fe3+ transport system substrate-binding protein